MRYLLIIFVVVNLVSCSGLKSIKPATTIHVKDSVHTSVHYVARDTTFFIPADSITISSLISELSEKPIFKKTEKSTISLRRVGNTVEAECFNEAQEIEIEYQAKIIEIYRQHEKQTDTIITNTVKYIPKLVKKLAWTGGIFIGVIVVAIGLKITKII